MLHFLFYPRTAKEKFLKGNYLMGADTPGLPTNHIVTLYYEM